MLNGAETTSDQLRPERTASKSPSDGWNGSGLRWNSSAAEEDHSDRETGPKLFVATKSTGNLLRNPCTPYWKVNAHAAGRLVSGALASISSAGPNRLLKIRLFLRNPLLRQVSFSKDLAMHRNGVESSRRAGFRSKRHGSTSTFRQQRQRVSGYSQTSPQRLHCENCIRAR